MQDTIPQCNVFTSKRTLSVTTLSSGRFDRNGLISPDLAECSCRFPLSLSGSQVISNLLFCLHIIFGARMRALRLIFFDGKGEITHLYSPGSVFDVFK